MAVRGVADPVGGAMTGTDTAGRPERAANSRAAQAAQITTTVVGATAAAGKEPSTKSDVRRATGPRRDRLWDLFALISSLLLGFYVTARLWRHPSHGIASNRMDQAFFEWMLAHGARVVTHLEDPFVTYRMNVPDAVNLMANTSVLGISIPLAPVTLLFGPHVAFNVFLTAAFVATAICWYFLLSRCVVRSRAAALLGALFCAGAPSMISHGNAHPNLVSQFLVPLIIWRVLRLRQREHWLRNGLLLGLLIIWQGFINLEVLLMTAVGLGIFVAVIFALRPDVRRDARPFAAGLAVAAVLAALALAYPVYVQFFGPGAYHGLPRDIRFYGADLGSYFAFSRDSIAGSPQTAKGLAQNPSEENAFFGWPLVILIVALVLWMRRSVAAVGLATAGLVFAIMSLGPRLSFEGHKTHIAMPWHLVSNVPVLSAVVPTRWALAITPVIGVLLALGVDRAVELARQHPTYSRQIRLAAALPLVMALLPVAPTPLGTRQLRPTPEFITSGAWRQYTDGGRSVVTLPMPGGTYPDPLRWAAYTGLDIRIPRGYFLGPKNDPKKPNDRTAIFGAPARPTSKLLDTIRREGEIPKITPERRAQAIEDLRYWRAGVVVLAPQSPQKTQELYRRAMSDLIGLEPESVGGVWIWDVRPLLANR